jgi:hypothetical protein
MSDDQNNMLSPVYNAVLTLESGIRGVGYRYMPEDEFRTLNSVSDVQFVYWNELVQRLHACAATSIRRAKKWFDALQSGYEAQNYYAFCSGVRGLIEACADSYYTLSHAVGPVCSKFGTIERALRGEAERMLLSEELENALIHYVFGRRLTKAEKAVLPVAHDAKHVTAYVESLGDEGVAELYSELCQVSHPSAMSLMPFLRSLKDYEMVLWEGNLDHNLNDDLLDQHKKHICAASTRSTMFAVCALRIINEFDAPVTKALRTDEQLLASVLEVELWNKLQSVIDASRREEKTGLAVGPTCCPSHQSA